MKFFLKSSSRVQLKNIVPSESPVISYILDKKEHHLAKHIGDYLELKKAGETYVQIRSVRSQDWTNVMSSPGLEKWAFGQD